MPVVEPSPLRPRATRAADASVFLLSMGFFPLLLAAVLFMTEGWDYSVLQAGLAVAPGPLMVALLSWPAGTLAARRGPRPLVVLGVLAAGNLWTLVAATDEADRLRVMLPAMVLGGIGVAQTFPLLAGAAVSDLPLSRQIGVVAGVAALHLPRAEPLPGRAAGVPVIPAAPAADLVR